MAGGGTSLPSPSPRPTLFEQGWPPLACESRVKEDHDVVLETVLDGIHHPANHFLQIHLQCRDWRGRVGGAESYALFLLGYIFASGKITGL